MSRAEAYAAAVERARHLKQDGVQLPLQLKNGVVVEDLGVVDLRPAFNTPLSLLTPGYRAVWKDPAVGSFVSEIVAKPGVNYPQFVVSLLPNPEQLEAIERSSSGGHRPALPGLEAASSSGNDPMQQPVLQHGSQPGVRSDGKASNQEKFQLAAARNADIAWAQVVGLQERARLQVDAAVAAAAAAAAAGAAVGNSSGLGAGTTAVASGAGNDTAAGSAAAASAGQGSAPHTDAALDPLLAQLLARAASLKGCWGRAMFGLADADVLQLIEALPEAEGASNYQFVDERGGWDKERELLAKGRWAKRSTLQAQVKRPPTVKRQQPLTAAGAAAPGKGAAASGTGAAPGPGPGRKRPHPAAAAAAAAAASAGSDSVLFGPAASKRYRAMGREDRQSAEAVDKVLDKMITRLEGWWVQETAKEAKKAEKAEARAAAREAKKKEKDAAKAEV
jgi:hypothetical protein